MTETPSVLYCHCAFARVVPAETKSAVLKSLTESGQTFEAVADLCEMSARKDARLGELCSKPNLRIAACYPRAVHWLVSAAGHTLPDSAAVANMRTDSPEKVINDLLSDNPVTVSQVLANASPEPQSISEDNATEDVPENVTDSGATKVAEIDQPAEDKKEEAKGAKDETG